MVSRVGSPMHVDPEPAGLFAGESIDSGSIVEPGTAIDGNASERGEPSSKESEDVVGTSRRGRGRGEPKRRSPNKRGGKRTPAYILLPLFVMNAIRRIGTTRKRSRQHGKWIRLRHCGHPILTGLTWDWYCR